MITVFAEQFIKPGKLGEVMALFKEIVEETVKENGCISYSLYQDVNDESHFTFFEEWENKEALDEMCSLNFINADFPPSVVGYSRRDPVKTESLKLLERFNEYGVKHITYHDESALSFHGFLLCTWSADGKRFLKTCFDFLDSLRENKNIIEKPLDIDAA